MKPKSEIFPSVNVSHNAGVINVYAGGKQHVPDVITPSRTRETFQPRVERAAAPAPKPVVEPTDEQLEAAQRCIEQLAQKVAEKNFGVEYMDIEDTAQRLVNLRSSHPTIRTLALALQAARSTNELEHVAAKARMHTMWAEISASLNEAGIGALGRIEMSKLAGNLLATAGVVLYAHRGYYLLRRGDLFHACGKPENFDEYVEKVLAPLGSDEVGLADWGHLCYRDAVGGPTLTPEQVVEFIVDPLEAMSKHVAALKGSGASIAPPRRSQQALQTYRLTPEQLRLAEAALRSGEATPEAELPLAVLAFQSALRGKQGLAVQARHLLRPGWSHLVLNALGHHSDKVAEAHYAAAREAYAAGRDDA